jgi:hypothetical protein
MALGAGLGNLVMHVAGRKIVGLRRASRQYCRQAEEKTRNAHLLCSILHAE